MAPCGVIQPWTRLGPTARQGQGTAPVYVLVRERVPFLAQDAVMYPHIEAVRDLVTSGRVRKAVEAVLARDCGPSSGETN